LIPQYGHCGVSSATSWPHLRHAGKAISVTAAQMV
jgi:hypothetical protein